MLKLKDRADHWLKTLFAESNDQKLRTFQDFVARTNALEPTLAKLSDDKLRAKTLEFKHSVDQAVRGLSKPGKGKPTSQKSRPVSRKSDDRLTGILNEILPHAYAVVREASKRTLGMHFFDVQLLGGVALHFDKIAEIQTGEGKTLVASLPAYLHALSGRGVHIVTLNDYLAARDADLMQPVYDSLGMSVGRIYSGQPSEERAAAYSADITYGAYDQFGFDYSRDKKRAFHESGQRPLHFAIVDDVDRILIDEAAMPIDQSTHASNTCSEFFGLYPKLCGLTAAAINEAIEYDKNYELDVVSIPTYKPSIRIDQVDVIYKTESVKWCAIVEEAVITHLTGRPVLLATTSSLNSRLIANLLKNPQKMTDFLNTKITKLLIALEEHKLEGPPSESLRKVLRSGLTDVDRFERLSVELAITGKKRPGFAKLLQAVLRTAKAIAAIKGGIECQVMDSDDNAADAAIAAQCGRKGAVTVATNLAGHGIYIQLGGSPKHLARARLKEESIEPKDALYDLRFQQLYQEMKTITDSEHEEIVSLGGLHVIGTERFESRRMDAHLRGRAGNQGYPGSTCFILSLEDPLMRIFGGDKIAKLMDFMKAEEDMPIESAMVTKSINNAQKKVEAHRFAQRTGRKA